MKFTVAVLTTLSLVCSSAAHMVMSEPAQWRLNDGKDQFPLDPTGLDFPCQNAHLQISPDVLNTPSATYTPGGKATLRVVGGATHGGGSGQMLITYDLPPTKDSEWRVLHSWQGDHPVKADGNTSDSAEEEHPAIEFPIPNGIPSGKATVAWSWFNRIGNREHYMKCATVEVTGGSEDKATLTSLPAAFRANSVAGCTVETSISAIDFGITNPEQVTKAPGVEAVPVPCGGGGGGSSSTGGATQGPDENESGGEVAPEVPATPIPEPVAPSPTPVPQPDNTGSSTGGACVEGTSVCSDGNTWSVCGSGIMQNMGPVPAGMTCQNGVLGKRSIRLSAEHRRLRRRL